MTAGEIMASKEKKISKDFTQGNVPKQLLWFALPFMASNALQVLYSTIDMIIVGKYVGTAGLSAVSQSSMIVNFATMMCLGFSNGGQVLVAQALGAGKRKEMNDIIGTLFSLIMMFAIFMSGVFMVGRFWILDTMNIPAESYSMAMDYLIICGLGLLFTAGYNMVSAVLRGMGDSKRPFLFICIASVINLILDILFTGVMGMGVAVRCRFGHASTRKLHTTYMEQTVEEGTCGDYDTFCMEGDTPYGVYTDDFAILYKQFVNGVLPDAKVGDIVKYLAPSPNKLLAVALSAGAPHGGTLRAIEHAELNGRAVGDDSRVSTECVNLTHYLPLGNTTDGGVATHLPNLVHVHRDETSLRTHIGRCCCRLASRVSGTNHNDVVEKFHCTYN